MKNSFQLFTYLFALCFVVLTFSSCGDDEPEGPTLLYTFDITATADSIQSTLISMLDSSTVEFGPGTYTFTNKLSMDDKHGITIRGAGMNQTIFDFSGQTAGAEGILVTNSNNVTIADLTVQETAGNGVEVRDGIGVTIMNVATIWETEGESTNGAYGLYPVGSTDVLLDGCLARGASDAGIYTGQCNNVIIRNCTAEENVAGFEVENTMAADVYNNTAVNNTAGIMIFDIPNLPQKNGHTTRVFDNTMTGNNFPNFASGGTVAQVPAGTGLLVMSTRNVEVFGNTFTDNKTANLGIVSYDVLAAFDDELSYDDPDYNPYLTDVYIHDNTFSRTDGFLAENNAVGTILAIVLGTTYPDVLYDGIKDPNATSDEDKVCLQNNGDIVFALLDVTPAIPTSSEVDVNAADSEFNCTQPALEPIVID